MPADSKSNPYEPPADSSSNAVQVSSSESLDSARKWLKLMGGFLGLIGFYALMLTVASILGHLPFVLSTALFATLYLLAAWLCFRASSLLKRDFQRYRSRVRWLMLLLAIAAFPYCTVPAFLVIRRMAKHQRYMH